MNSNANTIQSLVSYNPWWEGAPIPQHYNLPYERPLLKEIISLESIGRIIVIKGPRRVGKTTLLYQYIQKLLEKGIKGKSILFASMDDLNLRIPIEELIKSYLFSTNQDTLPEKLYLFLDEVQFLENWSTMVKVLTDRSKDIHTVVSGSSSSLLAKSSESLAGRTIEKLLLPFSVREMIGLKEKGSDLYKLVKNGKLKNIFDINYDSHFTKHEQQLKKYLSLYLKHGGFPHLFEVKDETLWRELLRTDIIQKAIYKDLTDLYGIKNPVLLEKLFLYLIEATSEIANLTSISMQLGISRETLNQYIEYLENAYLVFSLPKYSNYPKEILKSQNKIHLIDPSFSTLAAKVKDEQLLESAASTLLFHRNQKLYYWRQNYEVDIIFEENGNFLPIEVKDTSRDISLSDIRGVVNFMDKYRSDVGIIIYNGKPNEIDLGKNRKIKFFPSWYIFCLL